MLVKKTWTKSSYGVVVASYEGWFLFGIIPLYIKEKRK